MSQVFRILTVLVAILSIAASSPAAHKGSFRIVGGSEAKKNSFPFIVALVDKKTGSFSCAGSIISEEWVLTTAHCIFGKDPEDVLILAGKHDLTTKEVGEQTLKAQKFITHARFSLTSIGYRDMGLILLTNPITFSDTVKPVTLPKLTDTLTGKYYIAGWGSISTTLEAKFPTKLQFASVTILENSVCQDALGKYVHFDETNVCTGPLSGGVGHCGGDSGGPLIQIDGDNLVILGVISFAYIPCGTANMPPVLGSVPYYLEWIQEQMASKN